MGFDKGVDWYGFLNLDEFAIRDIIFKLQGGDVDANYEQPQPSIYYHSYFLKPFKQIHPFEEELSRSFVLQNQMTIEIIYRKTIMLRYLDGAFGKKLAKHWLIKGTTNFLLYKNWDRQSFTTTHDEDVLHHHFHE
jgi:hypothetical protein